MRERSRDKNRLEHMLRRSKILEENEQRMERLFHDHYEQMYRFAFALLHVNPEIRRSIDLSFQIVDRIHDILVSKGMKQKDLALLLGKREAEISKWMRGTHNFTIDTLVSIEDALQAPILNVVHQDLEICV
jgi:predicted XRE-type DNA-binding protein